MCVCVCVCACACMELMLKKYGLLRKDMAWNSYLQSVHILFLVLHISLQWIYIK